MIKEVILIIGVLYRLAVVFLVEIPVVLDWPINAGDCTEICKGDIVLRDVCVAVCNTRFEGINDYLAMDKTLTYPYSNLQKLNLFSLVCFTSPLFIAAIFGLLFKKQWAFKLGLISGGMYLSNMLLFYGAVILECEQYLTVLAYNVQDGFLALLLCYAGWVGLNRASEQPTNRNQKKKLQ
ncbi:hypothetical protein AKO1_010609 [Acrasis kona]|uniref:Uncharacterized protein n=1 Tax=Acrasis kona TaxID=1008807 RepID=A0AAW2ZJ01_9EUKA